MVKPKPAKFISANQPIVFGIRRPEDKKAATRLTKLLIHIAEDLNRKDTIDELRVRKRHRHSIVKDASMHE